MTSRQYTEWEAFNRVQPVGHARMDFYFSYLMQAIHNIAIGFAGVKGKEFKLEEFIPDWSGRKKEFEKETMSVEQMKAFWITFAEEHNKKVLEKQKLEEIQNNKKPRL